MKKRLLFLLILAACVASEPFPYRCGKINDNSLKNYNISKGDYFCVSDDIMKKTNSYSKDEFAEFTDYAVINKKFFDTDNRGRFGGSYFADKAGNKISVDKTIHVVNTKVFDEYQIDKRKKVAAQKEKEETAKITKIAKQNPEIRKKLKNQFFNRCEYNMQNGRVQLNQNYIQKMCECLACVFNGTPASDNAVYEYVEKNKQTLSSSEYIRITYGFYDQCDKYVTGIADFNPCKWANGEYPF
ncbi:MAG: hypothetical protein IKN73_04020 [Alphaproteobacteria bacterium]|nr:hypothetical protein [Alphaproteobacteria bacterium]